MLFGSIKGVFFRLQLRLQASQNLQIATYLCRKLSYVLALELANLFFLVRQSFPSSFQLAFQKLGGAFRLLLAHFQIFADKQVGELAGNLLSNTGIMGRVVDVE